MNVALSASSTTSLAVSQQLLEVCQKIAVARGARGRAPGEPVTSHETVVLMDQSLHLLERVIAGIAQAGPAAYRRSRSRGRGRGQARR